MKKSSLESLPRRIFLDSCTAQTLRDFDSYIYEGEELLVDSRIHRVPDGVLNVQALRNIFLVSERANFEWIISSGSISEASDKGDPGHLQWLWDISHHTEVCLQGSGPDATSEALAAKLDLPKFGYLSDKDRLLLREAVSLRCEAFLTMERRLPKNAAHIERELGIRILTPIVHWVALQPWAALWR